jgi:hypothetical protein
MVDFYTGWPDGLPTTNPNITQEGVTYAAVVEHPATALSTDLGSDGSADGGYRLAVGGQSTAAAVVTGNITLAREAGSWQTRLRTAPAADAECATATATAGDVGWGTTAESATAAAEALDATVDTSGDTGVFPEAATAAAEALEATADPKQIFAEAALATVDGQDATSKAATGAEASTAAAQGQDAAASIGGDLLVYPGAAALTAAALDASVDPKNVYPEAPGPVITAWEPTRTVKPVTQYSSITYARAQDATIAGADAFHSGPPSTMSVAALAGAISIGLPGAVATATITAYAGSAGTDFWINGQPAIAMLTAHPGQTPLQSGAVAAVTVQAIAGTHYGSARPPISGPVSNITVRAPNGAVNGGYTHSARVGIRSGSRSGSWVDVDHEPYVELGAGSTLTAQAFAYLHSSGNEATQFAVGSRADCDIRLAPTVPDFIKTPLRTVLRVDVSAPEPAVIAGVPWLPENWVRPDTTATVAGHAWADHEPPPVIVIYNRPPPPQNSGAARPLRWVANGLPGGYLSSWPEASGGPAWQSGNGYEPIAGAQGVFRHGEEYIHGGGVNFHYDRVSHMWLDLGFDVGVMTWVMAAIVFDYPTRMYGHYMLDAGTATPALTPTYGEQLLGQQGLAHRSLMLLQRRDQLLCTRPVVEDGVYVRSAHNFTPQPRMYYGVYNGASSRMGTIGRGYNVGAVGTTDMKTHRNFVTGRRFNKLSRALAAHFVMFEMRFFPFPLDSNQLNEQYSNLASVHNFNAYRY